MLAELLGNVALYFSWALLGLVATIGAHRHHVAMARVRADDARRARVNAYRSTLERVPTYDRLSA